uniref:protein BIG GRAIN 1-like E n=1 Tax=Erigeron canadensis TaxID=72917 RepID=UPI001CB95244|nr:protein BIG GRAIN 1-like E [Erigeron canadensis]
MPKTIPTLQENKKPFHRRNGSGDLHVFEAARYFEASNPTLTHKRYMREGVGRLSLDIPNNRINSTPLETMMENRNSVRLRDMIMDHHNPMVIKNEKKYKQPSSPGGKLAHFLNSLFNQTSSKKSKSKSKSISSIQSIKDEDESPSSWRRKRRSSISLFRSGNNSNVTHLSDTKSSCSKTPPSYHIPPIRPTSTKTTTYRDLISCSHHKPTCETTKPPIIESHKNGNQKVKSGLYEKKSLGNGLLEKSKVCDIKQDDHHQKYDPTMETKELKRFILDDDDDGGDSDSSSDLFELTNCDLGYYSSGLPVFETTHIDSIKRGAPISS